ncbi:hypothetical protein Tco_0900443 [Tanacetum coccineum]
MAEDGKLKIDTMMVMILISVRCRSKTLYQKKLLEPLAKAKPTEDRYRGRGYDRWQEAQQKQVKIMKDRRDKVQAEYHVYGCQDKKVMEKQHCVNIMEWKFKSGGFGRGQGRGRGSGKSRNGNERLQRDAMLHVTCVANNQKVVKAVVRDFDGDSLKSMLPKAVSSLEWAV